MPTTTSTPATYAVRIHPSGPLGGYVAAPPSKNYTTRLILGATLADWVTTLTRPAANDDARALVRCCRALGAKIEEQGADLTITGVAGRPANPGCLNPGNAGAVLRFLLGAACLVEGEVLFETDFAESLGRRPNEDLLAALRQLGAEAEGTGPDGRLPIRIAGGRGRVKGADVRISGASSSQFLSSLLYFAPYLNGDTRVSVRDPGAPADRPGRLVSRPLIEQTLECAGQFQLALRADFDRMEFLAPGGQCGYGGPLLVNGDWPSGAALLSAVAVAGGMATFYGLVSDAQGERRAREALGAMGCDFPRLEDGEIVIHGKGELRPIRFNGDLATDAVLALVAAACLADGTSRFEGVANLRLKECNRIDEPLEELAKLGIVGRAGPDWIEIDGRPDGLNGGIEVDSHGDHRVAQMLAIVGLRCRDGLTIRRASDVSKSYPDFFSDLVRLGVKLDFLKE